VVKKKFRFSVADFPKRAPTVFSCNSFIVKFQDNGLSYNRFAVLISNHSEKSAVRRHFWKRRFFDELKSWPDLGKDFLVIASPKIKNLTPDNLKIEIQKALEKSK